MKRVSVIVGTAFTGFALSAPVLAHSAESAVHKFDLVHAISHILTNPDHWGLFILVGLVGGYLGLRAMKRVNGDINGDQEYVEQ